MKKGQVAIEFILLISMSMVLLILFMVAIQSLGTSKTDEKAYTELNDLGISLQEEFITAAEMQVGYHRVINIPYRIHGREYEITIINATNSTSQIIIDYKNTTRYYAIPITTGQIQSDINTISTTNNGVRIN